MTEIERAAAETERLCHELDIANADHIVLWLETNLAEGCGATLAYLACRIIEAHERALSAQASRVAELEGALGRIISTHADARDIFPDFEQEAIALAEIAQEALGREDGEG